MVNAVKVRPTEVKVRPTEGVYAGKLIYNDNAEYILDLGNGDTINISDVLRLVYFNQFDNRVNIKIVHGGRIAFMEDSLLYYKKDEDGLFSFHISSENLEKKLFNVFGENIEIEIYAKALEETDYGTVNTIKK